MENFTKLKHPDSIFQILSSTIRSHIDKINELDLCKLIDSFLAKTEKLIKKKKAMIDNN
jgi:chromatin segregation and condensation protein Rec8/ScpA/Scc1 (kleisin family)